MILKSNIGNKNQYWQIIRGICILAVVLIHCPANQNLATMEGTIWLILRKCINFPVAVFVFLAGYFTKTEGVQKDTKAYLLNRGGYRLLLPYLIWSMLYILIALFRGNSITLKQVLYYLVFGKASTPLYYIIVMLQLTIITPYIIKRKISVWMYMITPIYMLVLYVYNISIGETLPLYETWFCAWFIFYLLGIDCRRGRWNHIINRAKNWWIIIALLFSIVEAFILAEMSENVGFACSQITFGSFVYTLAMIAWFMKNENTRKESVLSLVGNYSYGIYFCHMIVLMIVKKLLSIIGVADMWFVYYILTFLLTALGSVFVVGLVRGIATRVNARKILKVIGF